MNTIKTLGMYSIQIIVQKNLNLTLRKPKVYSSSMHKYYYSLLYQIKRVSTLASIKIEKDWNPPV